MSSSPHQALAWPTFFFNSDAAAAASIKGKLEGGPPTPKIMLHSLPPPSLPGFFPCLSCFPFREPANVGGRRRANYFSRIRGGWLWRGLSSPPSSVLPSKTLWPWRIPFPITQPRGVANFIIKRVRGREIDPSGGKQHHEQHAPPVYKCLFIGKRCRPPL